MSTQDLIQHARVLYERAVFGGDRDALPLADQELDSVEADLALARGRIMHARFLDQRAEDPRELELFERAVELYHALGDDRGEAESLFWVGCFLQVVQDDSYAALPFFQKSRDLAERAGDKLTASYALRHLAFAAQSSGRPDLATEYLEASTRLRREIGFMPGVAANLVALAYVAGEQDRTAEALALLEEAQAAAQVSDATGILRSVREARERLRGAGPPGTR